MSDNEYWQLYAPPLDVLLDLDELGERHGLRKRTLEWIERVKAALTDAPLEEPGKPVQQSITKEKMRYG